MLRVGGGEGGRYLHDTQRGLRHPPPSPPPPEPGSDACVTRLGQARGRAGQGRAFSDSRCVLLFLFDTTSLPVLVITLVVEMVVS